MSHLLSEKSLDCLLFIAARTDAEQFSGWAARYEQLCEKWGEKPAVRALEKLAERGYIDYGVSVRMGWLTDKGKQKLLEAVSAEQLVDLIRTWQANATHP